MRIELIDENKIRVILSCYDILELNFDVSSLSTDNFEARLLINDILKEAEEQLGFSAHLDKIMIESVPSAKDGYVIYITKIEKNRYGLVDANTMTNDNTCVFSFVDFFSLKIAIRAIDDLYCGSSDLYALDGKYYLILDSVVHDSVQKTDVVLSDYGEKVLGFSIFERVLNEYGKLLYKKNALNMIKNKKNR